MSLAEKLSAIKELRALLAEDDKRFGTYVEDRLLGPGEGTWSHTAPEEWSAFLATGGDEELDWAEAARFVRLGSYSRIAPSEPWSKQIYIALIPVQSCDEPRPRCLLVTIQSLS